MKAKELIAAFDAVPDDGMARFVSVVTRSGKVYEVHEDQTEILSDDSLIYGVPRNPHPRDGNVVRWFKVANIRLAEEVA